MQRASNNSLLLLKSFIFTFVIKYKHKIDTKISVEYCLKIEENKIKGWLIANKESAQTFENLLFR